MDFSIDLNNNLSLHTAHLILPISFHLSTVFVIQLRFMYIYPI